LSLSTQRSPWGTSRLQDYRVQEYRLPPPTFKCNVLCESLSVDSQNIPCTILKRRGSWVISVYLWEIGTSETNHLIMWLVGETRTLSLATSCKEGMIWCSSRPMPSLWSVHCVLCGSVALTRTHWPLYRTYIHKANLLKKLTLKLVYIHGYSQTSFLLFLNVN
jgi:hypothetical protein